jgi:hypothetical protein
MSIFFTNVLFRSVINVRVFDIGFSGLILISVVFGLGLK